MTRTALAQADSEGFSILCAETDEGYTAWATDGMGAEGWHKTAETEIDARLATLHALVADGHEVRPAKVGR